MTVYGNMKIDAETMEAIASYMRDEIREDLHAEMAPCGHEEFLEAYLQRDPEFAELLKNEFDFDRNGVPEKKYWLDCDSNEGTQFALYEKDGDEETCVLKFDFDDIDGLQELEQADKIVEAYKLIDAYIEEKLGFLPDYEVG